LAATHSRVDELQSVIQTAARANAAGAHGSHQHLRQGERQYRVGLLPMGFFWSGGGQFFDGAWTNYLRHGEKGQPLADRTRPHLCRAKRQAASAWKRCRAAKTKQLISRRA